MSRSYAVKKNDTLGAIAIRYYGVFDKYHIIVDANPQLIGRGKACDGSPLVYPGDVLIIPEERPIEPEPKKPEKTEAPKKKEIPVLPVNTTPLVLDDNAPNDIVIVVNGKSFTGFSGYTISMPVDKFDSFAFSAPFDDTVKDIRGAFLPFTYQSCNVYYDKKLLFNGTLLTPDPEANADSKNITLQGYPLCGVINDCCLPETKFPPEYNGLSLSEIAKDAVSPFGIGVSVEGDEGGSFEKVEYSPGDTLMAFLNKLAEERGMLISNAINGDLLFWHPEKEQVCDSIQEGKFPFLSCKAAFNSQSFYSHITGFSKVDKEEDSSSFTYENQYLIKKGVLRTYNYTVDDANSDDLEKAVKAKAGRMFAGAVQYTLTVVGHKNSKGELWRKNMAISVLSPGAFIFKETVMLVDSVEISRSDTDGNKTVLTLVLPGARDGTLSEEWPWEE